MFKIELTYSYQNAKYTIDKSNNIVKITNEIIDYDNCKRYQFFIEAKESIKLIDFSIEKELKIEKEDKIYCNGYQTWTDSIEYDLNDKMRGLIHTPKFAIKKYSLDKYGDYHFKKYSNIRGHLHSYTYSYLRKNGGFQFLGSLNDDFAYTLIEMNTVNKLIRVNSDIRNFEALGKVKLLDFIMMNSSTLDNVFRTYKELLGVKPNNNKKIQGFTTWYNYYENINETIVMDAIKYSKDNNFDLVQIDDGYTIVGDWLDYLPNKFPNGLECIVKKIHEEGMLAGLWLAPFVVSVNAKLLKEHPEYIARDNNNEFLRAGCGWGGFYALNLERDDVKEYVKRSISYVVNELKFDFLKLDFLYSASLLSSPTKPRAKILNDAMKLVREAAGNAKILGCGAPLAPVFGLVDYCRISCDVSLLYDDKWFMKLVHRERISTKNAILNTIFRRTIDNLGFLNDPDVFVLRDDNNKLTFDQKKILVTVNFLCGSLLLTSDNPNEYPDDIKEMYNDARKLVDASVIDATITKGIVSIKYTLKGNDYEFRFDSNKGKIIK